MTSVLVVDDLPEIRHMISRWLDSAGFAPREAESAEAALDAMSQDRAAVALCDIGMPGRDGLWLAEQLREQYPSTALIMATGQDNPDTVISSLKTGVMDYLIKPFDAKHLLTAVQRGARWHDESVAAEQRLSRLEHEAESRRNQLREALSLAEINSNATVKALLAMLTLHDRDAYEHGLRVSALAVEIADEIGIGEPTRGDIEIGALLHDVGKMAVPEDVLTKPSSLTDPEAEQMRTHAEWGARIMRTVPFLCSAADLVETSHERFDGSGYPHGLKGQEIPVGARILAVADSFDAMTGHRAYRNSVSEEEAFADVFAKSGTLYDPGVVAALSFVLNSASHSPNEAMVRSRFSTVDNPGRDGTWLASGAEAWFSSDCPADLLAVLDPGARRH